MIDISHQIDRRKKPNHIYIMEKYPLPRFFSNPFFLEQTNITSSKESEQHVFSSSEDSEHLQDPNFLSDFASDFTTRDARSLKVTFRSATQIAEVIPTHLNSTLC
jgi:hypothetical protein